MASPGPKDICNLPAEIISKICGSLSKSDHRSLRLCCRDLESKSNRDFAESNFPHLTFSMTKPSIAGVAELSRSPFAPKVLTLTFDLIWTGQSLFQGGVKRHELPDRYRLERLGDSFSDEDWDVYTDFLMDRDNFYATEADFGQFIASMTDAFSRFNNCHAVRLGEFAYLGTRGIIKPTTSPAVFNPEIQGVDIAVMLLLATVGASSVDITEVRTETDPPLRGGIPLLDVYVRANSPYQDFRRKSRGESVNRAIRKLNVLSFSVGDIADELTFLGMYDMPRFFNAARELRDLTMRFTGQLKAGTRVLDCLSNQNAALQVPRLVSLSLHDVSLNDPQVMERFLLLFRPTLKKLYLEDVTLSREMQDEPDELLAIYVNFVHVLADFALESVDLVRCRPGHTIWWNTDISPFAGSFFIVVDEGVDMRDEILDFIQRAGLGVFRPPGRWLRFRGENFGDYLEAIEPRLAVVPELMMRSD